MIDATVRGKLGFEGYEDPDAVPEVADDLPDIHMAELNPDDLEPEVM